jgi:uncharacterized RDD family membrane protein YckC
MAYHIARNNQQLGQFDEGLVRQKLSEGEFLATDLCWTEGMADWQPLGQVVAAAAAAALLISEVNPYAPPTVERTYRAAAMPTGVPLATLGQRLGAFLLDRVAALVTLLPMILAFGPMNFLVLVFGPMEFMEAAQGSDPTSAKVEPNMELMALAGVFLLFFLVVLGINLFWLIKRGQSIGKRIVGIRIVGVESDANPGGARTVLLRGILNFIIVAFVPFYSLIDILFIFGKDRRCLHDLIAGTRVVQGQPEQA